MRKNVTPGLRRYGSREAVADLHREELTEAWKHLIHNAKIEIMVLGDCNPQPVYDGFAQAFSKIDRKRLEICETEIIKTAKEVREISETMSVAQSKVSHWVFVLVAELGYSRGNGGTVDGSHFWRNSTFEAIFKCERKAKLMLLLCCSFQ